MESSTTANKKLSISEILPIGYLYLLLLGIISDSIFYAFIGINIISYSTVLDVILSPIVYLTSNYVVPFFILLLPIFIYFYILFIKWLVNKKVKIGEQKPSLMIKMSISSLWLIFTAFVIFCAYLGFGIGGGISVRNSIQSEDFTPKDRITFMDNTSQEVKIIGNNSGYVFYATKGSKAISISPISGNIKKIEKVEKGH